jgi:hypothetical protein
VDCYGAQYNSEIMSCLEERLSRPDTGSVNEDHVREAAVVMLGALGKHLPDGTAQQ